MTKLQKSCCPKADVMKMLLTSGLEAVDSILAIQQAWLLPAAVGMWGSTYMVEFGESSQELGDSLKIRLYNEVVEQGV